MSKKRSRNSEWFKKNAIFYLPNQAFDHDDAHPSLTKAPSTSTAPVPPSSINADTLIKAMPDYAFHDCTLAERLIKIADDALDCVNPISEDRFQNEYLPLFSPYCDYVDGTRKVKRLVCKTMHNKKDGCNWAQNTLCDAINFTINDLFGIDIRMDTEYSHDKTVAVSTEKVDFMLINSDTGKKTLMGEMKQPSVVEGKTSLAYMVPALKVSFTEKKGEVLPPVYAKCVFYLLSHTQRHIVLFWCTGLTIFDSRNVDAGGNDCVAYSPIVEVEGKSEPFRVLLGLLLVSEGLAILPPAPNLNDAWAHFATYHGSDAQRDFYLAWKQQGLEKAHKRSGTEHDDTLPSRGPHPGPNTESNDGLDGGDSGPPQGSSAEPRTDSDNNPDAGDSRPPRRSSARQNIIRPSVESTFGPSHERPVKRKYTTQPKKQKRKRNGTGSDDDDDSNDGDDNDDSDNGDDKDDNDNNNHGRRGPPGGPSTEPNHGPRSEPSQKRSSAHGTRRSTSSSKSRPGGTRTGRRRNHSALPPTLLGNSVKPPSPKIQKLDSTKTEGHSAIIIQGLQSVPGAKWGQKVKLTPERGVPFPPFPTSETPVLQVVKRDMGPGVMGVVCSAKLLNPNVHSVHPKYFAVKLVDISRLPPDGDCRNYAQDLCNEFLVYCILQASADRYSFVEEIVRRHTAICYGLYEHNEDKTKYALITEYVGETPDKPLKELEHKEKLAVFHAFASLHSLGMFHNDVAGRNIVLDRLTVKIIDFGDVTWHTCRGIGGYCTELLCVQYVLFNGLTDEDERLGRIDEAQNKKVQAMLQEVSPISVEREIYNLLTQLFHRKKVL
ncbi:uncharacterized protein FOMMEDRAFT_146995 [Fomitiporia mediterranea MF3/22]|uniref:uncharacterized protein n=1 Tax=Fomitiporia mediterranea (strain MF3/22) TaxID=694068 RepID=UPI0004408569|nr:uncharacterized protein FOMMEDRAFT_146995 [Fomitiporia mediterranea MF3/22]EJD03476.1 hypothetical protein FOMMEDRAFT_146995 [Fomitiporia mediterranea MF3/22]